MRAIGIGLVAFLSGCASIPIKAPDNLKEAIYDHVQQSGEEFSSRDWYKQDGKRVYFALREGCGMVQTSQVEGIPILFIDVCSRERGTTFGYNDFSSDVPQWIGERPCQCDGDKPIPVFSASINNTDRDSDYYHSLLEKIYFLIR